MSSGLEVVLAGIGVGTILLGFWHLSVPRIFAFDQAIGIDDQTVTAGLGEVRLGPWQYDRRRADAIGLTWVMSNAASYVLVSIGILDVAWALGDRTIPIAIGSSWVAAWWALRAAGQFTLGRRRIDVAMASAFAVLGAIHVVAVVVA